MREGISYNLASQLLPSADEHQTRSKPLKASWRDRVNRLDWLGKTRWSDVGGSVTIVLITTIVGFFVEPVLKGSNLAILYMLAVMFSALQWNRRTALLTATLCALSLVYFFLPPFGKVAIKDLWHLISLFGFLTAGLAISLITVMAKEDAALARRREAYAAALYSFTNALASANRLDEILETVSRHFFAIFQRQNVVVARDGDELTFRGSNAKLTFAEDESQIIAWVFKHGEEAGYGSKNFANSNVCYRPVQAAGHDTTIGVIGFQAANSKETLPPELDGLLSIFLSQTALAITKADLAKKAKRAEVLQETDKLQKALLNSVSHNLRTPLASILGALSTILEDGSLLDPSTQEGLLRTAKDEAKRLEWLVQNLLDMTRLEGGAIRVRTEPCDVHDTIAAALQQLGEAGHGHRISVNISPDLPLVPMDDVLIVQVVVNLLDNAMKYSAASSPIEIEAKLDGGRLNIRVLDRGLGIAEHELEKVFEKFYRGSAPGAPKGAGLGLSICKGLVEAHHGQILAKRREGGGTEVALLLPLEACHA
jgi:two-component system, OmpR family, sensor histidine kinase KdpD